MPYFPFFADISGQPCLVVGGGRIALHKIVKLLPFQPEIHVVAENISPEIEELPGLHLIRRDFKDSDINGMCFAIAATDSPGVNSRVARLCTERRIPVNAVDDPSCCTFYFPALAQKGDITVGISTAGKSPLLAAKLRRQAEGLLTPEMAEICSLMGVIRPYVRSRFSDEKKRAEVMAAALEYCCCGNLPNEEQLMEYIDTLEINA